MTKKPHGLTGKPSNRLGKRTAEPSTTLSLRIPVKLRAALLRQSEAEGITLNALAVDALVKRLD